MDGIAVLVAVVVKQGVFHPIAAQTVHAEAFALVHQFFGEETGHVAEAYDDVAAEDVVGIADLQHFECLPLVFENIHIIDVHRDALRAHLDFPLVACLGVIII